MYERVLVRKPERKRRLERLRRRWEDNIKMDLQEVVCAVNRPEGAGSKASSLRQPDRPLREAIFRPLVTSRRNWWAWEGVVYTD